MIQFIEKIKTLRYPQVCLITDDINISSDVPDIENSDNSDEDRSKYKQLLLV